MNITVNKNKIYYEENGSGIPVVMLHGWGTDQRILKGCLEPVFNKYSEKFKRIYFDLPGMGKSKKSIYIKSSDDYLFFIKSFIDEVAEDSKYILIGKSYGGYLARGLAKLDRKRVTGMLQICPLVNVKTQLKNAPERCVMEREIGIERIIPPKELKSFEMFHVVQTKKTWESYRDYILPGVKLADYDFLNNILENNKEFSEDVDNIEMEYEFPSLMLAGKQDWCVGYSDLWKIQKNFKRSTYLALDKAGHNLEYEYPELFQLHVKRWLKEVLEYSV